MDCTGEENNLWACSYSTYCDSFSDIIIAIECQCKYSCIKNDHFSIIYFTNANYTVDTSCNNNDVHLVGGINKLEGRVEMCYNKLWLSVCINSWTATDAKNLDINLQVS